MLLLSHQRYNEKARRDIGSLEGQGKALLRQTLPIGGGIVLAIWNRRRLFLLCVVAVTVLAGFEAQKTLRGYDSLLFRSWLYLSPFHHVREGWTKKQVQAKLGQPDQRVPYEFHTTWVYTRPQGPAREHRSLSYARVYFGANGRVTETSAPDQGKNIDLSAIARGMTESDVLARIGKPDSIGRLPIVEVWQYRGWAGHHKRLQFDRAGRVLRSTIDYKRSSSNGGTTHCREPLN